VIVARSELRSIYAHRNRKIKRGDARALAEAVLDAFRQAHRLSDPTDNSWVKSR